MPSAQIQALAAPAGTWPVVFMWTVTSILGACLGSFGNVLVYRLPRNISVVRPRSRCPGCDRPVAWHENIPVLGWLMLRGRCRGCGCRIAVRYPLVEGAGTLFLAAGILRFGWTIQGLAAGLFLLVLLLIAIIDWEHMIIPHTLTLGGSVVGLAAAATAGGIGPALWGLLAGAGIILAVAYGYKLVRGRMGMGGGDVMMMAMLGTFVGPWGVPAVLFAGSVAGTLYAAFWGTRRDDGVAKLPFGTFLALAGALVYFAGPAILSWYLRLF